MSFQLLLEDWQGSSIPDRGDYIYDIREIMIQTKWMVMGDF